MQWCSRTTRASATSTGSPEPPSSGRRASASPCWWGSRLRLGEDARSQGEPHQFGSTLEPQPVLDTSAVLVHRPGPDVEFLTDLPEALYRRAQRQDVSLAGT